ncbi:MAG: substrate-binding domain-containing protein [Alphaproteobacteria bacterium]
MTSQRTLALCLLTGSMLVPVSAALAQDKVIGVSWRHFQEERWRIDERGILDALEGPGWEYVSADAQADPQKQITDIEGLISSGADVLIVLAQDSFAVVPAIQSAQAAGIPVIAYDVPVDMTDILFISFDNIAVGRLMGEALVAAQPGGNWAILNGDPSMSIVNLFKEGQMQAVQPLIDSGAITVVAEQFIENWKPDVAQTAMDQILTMSGNEIDAVLAMNDGMAGGAAAAMAAQGMHGVALSGQDGDIAALNRIARGDQTVSVWKNSYSLGQTAAVAAVALGEGTPMAEVAGAQPYETPSGQMQSAILLEPIAITRDNLNLVVDSDWISKEDLCQGVTENAPAACQ